VVVAEAVVIPPHPLVLPQRSRYTGILLVQVAVVLRIAFAIKVLLVIFVADVAIGKFHHPVL